MQDVVNKLVANQKAQSDISKKLMKNKGSREYMMEQMFYIANKNSDFYNEMHDFVMQNNKVHAMVNKMIKGSTVSHAMMKMKSNNN